MPIARPGSGRIAQGYLARPYVPPSPRSLNLASSADQVLTTHKLRTVVSEVRAPEGVNYLNVSLREGDKWRYEPPSGHTVAWAAVHEGQLATPAIGTGELAVFEESNGAIDFEAIENTGFIIGSAVKHPHDLVLGAYSVHTTRHAPEEGEARIAEIGKRYPFVRS